MDRPAYPAKKLSPSAEAYRRFELEVFDTATYFTAATSLGTRDGKLQRSTERFDDLPAAIAAAEKSERTVTYAANAKGRSIILDRTDWPMWLTRWNRNNQKETTDMSDANDAATIGDRGIGGTGATGPMEMAAGSVFMIHWNGGGPKTAEVERFRSKADADAYAYESLPGDRSAFVVTGEADITRELFGGPTLLTVFNRLAGLDVARFSSFGDGAARLWRCLTDTHGKKPYTEPVQPPAPVVKSVAPSKGARKMSDTTTKEKPTSAGHRGKESPIPADHIVTVKTLENPKRAGTGNHTRYDAMLKILDGGHRCTVDAARKAGVTLGDLVFNVKKGYIAIAAPGK